MEPLEIPQIRAMSLSTHSVKCDSKLGLYGGQWVVGVVVENVVIMDEV